MKSLLFTDIHWGRSNNSDNHNQHCLNVINDVMKYTSNNSIDNIIFLGDWFDTRTTINVKTMNLAYNAISKLNTLGIKIYMIVGNHDSYERNSRRYHSLTQYELLDNVIIVNNIMNIDDEITLIPYLFGDENELISKIKNKNVLGHLEIDGFAKGEHSQTKSMFKKFKRVLSGHFHNTASSGNITYIGNPFQFDFGERDDTNKGLTIFDTENDTIDKIKLTENYPLYIQGAINTVIERMKENKNRELHLHIIIDREDDVNELKEKILSHDIQIYHMKFTSIDNNYSNEEIDMTNILDIKLLVRNYIVNNLQNEELTKLFDDVTKD